MKNTLKTMVGICGLLTLSLVLALGCAEGASAGLGGSTNDCLVSGTVSGVVTNQRGLYINFVDISGYSSVAEAANNGFTNFTIPVVLGNYTNNMSYQIYVPDGTYIVMALVDANTNRTEGKTLNAGDYVQVYVSQSWAYRETATTITIDKDSDATRTINFNNLQLVE